MAARGRVLLEAAPGAAQPGVGGRAARGGGRYGTARGACRHSIP